ncbi:MAG: CopG family transcriptional regulator [Caulobacteraceae bacterium]|nr:CopG family transcriptional regulator [Caulobacteraceae bacterium]
MAKTATLTLRVSPDLKDKLARLAAGTDRTTSAIAQRALEAYADHHIEMLDAVERGREDFRQGRTHTHEEVMRDAAEILARHKSKTA